MAARRCPHCDPDELGACEPLIDDKGMLVMLNPVMGRWFLSARCHDEETGRVMSGGNARVRHCPACGRRL